MTRLALPAPEPALPKFGDIVELSKPITWFPPMWAFGCGVVASGVPVVERWEALLAGVLLTGPLVCGTSQIVNDWYDRHVDAINQPGRPIPSGRIPGRWGLGLAMAGTLLSLAVAALTGWLVLLATTAALVFAWAYSAPPVRLKTSGWWGPLSVALSYEGLTWLTGSALMLGALPSAPVLAVLLLYSLGAHGIMTLNDFKAIEGDQRMGIRSLPATLGPERAARLACWTMAVPQVAVVALLFSMNLVVAGALVSVGLALQIACMARLRRDPRGLAPWYNATGVTLYVLGMLASAFGLGSLT
jgi:chlorophyll synthase